MAEIGFLAITFEQKVVACFCLRPCAIIWPLRISQNLNELSTTIFKKVRSYFSPFWPSEASQNVAKLLWGKHVIKLTNSAT